MLTDLCHRSFLRLWAHANLYTDEDLRDGKGSTKELSDALVVFGDDVVIFSDKHIEFQEHKLLDVAWKRWYKRAIDESMKQLFGARAWLQRFPTRVFLDPKCTRPIPVAIPGPERARYHLVAVTRGTKAAVTARFGGIGSLFVSTDLKGYEQHLGRPFMVGQPAPQKGFVHVFDEASLEVVMAEMDTAPDFLRYLADRAKFLEQDGRIVHAPGEEELVAAYLRTMDAKGQHCFVRLPDGPEEHGLVVFDGSHYEGLLNSPEYRRKKRADSTSYFWDGLIDHFIRLGDPSIAPLGVQSAPAEVEEALRHLAAESRFRRRLLTTALKGAFERAMHAPRAARVFRTTQDPDPAYVFLVVGKPDDLTYEEYRKYRVALLSAYCRTAKLTSPESNTFVGLAVDHPNKDYEGNSEDLMVWVQQEWTDEIKATVQQMREELGILGQNMLVSSGHQDEFPAEFPHAPAVPQAENSRPTRDKKRKRMDKIRSKSKRQNRKRK